MQVFREGVEEIAFFGDCSLPKLYSNAEGAFKFFLQLVDQNGCSLARFQSWPSQFFRLIELSLVVILDDTYMLPLGAIRDDRLHDINANVGIGQSQSHLNVIPYQKFDKYNHNELFPI